MPEKIKLTSEELGLISLLQNMSGATARDCLIDPKMNRVIFLVPRDEMGLAIGKNGQLIKNMQRLVGKSIELVEFSEDPKELIANSLKPGNVREVRVTEKLDGTKFAVVVVSQKHKGAVIGKDGKNAEKARLLARRYFQISTVQIVTQQ